MSFLTFEALGLPMLANHWPTVIASAIVWHCVWIAGWRLSDAYLPTFKTFKHKGKSDWAMRAVSFSHSTLIAAMALPILLDEDLQKDRVFGYKPFAGNVYAVTCGYFIWDTCYSIYEGNAGFITHGIACLIVYTFSFRPFLQYYGAVFLMFELSTPFLNLINGLILLAMFFVVRLCFGFYSSFNFFLSIAENFDRIPLYLTAIYCTANVVLNSLNVLWFYKMILSVMKRFKPKPKPKTQ
ncbi:TLC domain-containing protein [Chytridium lagenaria]|nr:TLC domain-containing protein [Chytridium lagenaria]